CHVLLFFFSSRRRHTRFSRDWSSDVCSSDLPQNCQLLLAICSCTNSLLQSNACISGARLGRPVQVQRAGTTLMHWLCCTRREHRSEERRVGKEWRTRWAPCHYNRKRRTQ